MALAERKKDQRIYKRVKVIRRRLPNEETGRMETLWCSVPVGPTHTMMWTRY
jgi:hypothetical protein